ncbi:hypothetical protein [Paucibacter sp. XJ19-41]|uniref:hypothetical protein n=1 Tax=Paucibacter sp. XJ19-41 TaxID=2927824 RepID=UPI002349DCCD|nr:hypothetical protein [Paucibacter sp. XJ19-41]MDC6168443.1 hypothetical protein [Paucibacter sp. XJ19-41]
MRRFVLILMLTLLPLQWTWAAAASYCEHETEASAAAHFGHHQHEHQDSGDADVDGSGIDADCPSCHGAVAGIMMVQPPKPQDWPADSQATPYRRSVTDGLPERLIRPPHTSPV